MKPSNAAPSTTAAVRAPAPLLGAAIHFILLVVPQLGLHAHLGSAWLNAVIAGGALLLLYKLATFRRWNDELKYAPRFARAVVFILAVVIVENFATWATSASDRRKHFYTPLQDNAEIVLLWLFQRYPAARRTLIDGWGVDTHFMLHAFVAMAVSVLWDLSPHSGFGMGARFMDTIAWTHLIRTVAFMTTVLPNPKLQCYARNFPRVPDSWAEFVRIGFSAKRGSGCNDLVISGHGVVYAAVALALHEFFPTPLSRWGPRTLGWIAVIKLCIQETLDKTHYSVDMFLAVVLTYLVWKWRESVYPADDMWQPRPAGAPADPVPRRLVALVVVTLVFFSANSAGMEGAGRRQALFVVLALAAGLLAGAQELPSDLCFNQLQVLGTHNSYHQTPPQALIDHFGGAASPLLAWQYSHPPLTTQLDGGVRSFELDAYWDPQGGLYGQAAGLRIAGRNGWLSDAKYKQPGFKTLHVPDFDTSTNCILLADCLAELKRWSDANPRHLPLRVYIEVKESGQLQEALGPALVGILDTMLLNSTAEGPSSFVQQPVNTAQTFRDLNAELASVFGADGGQLLTPDGLRKELGAAEGADLTQLLLQSPPGSGPCPWPPLERLRGKVFVVLIVGRATSTEAKALYEAFPDLKGSLAWVEQAGRTPMPHAVFRAAAVGRMGGNSLSLDLPDNATALAEALAGGVRNASLAGYLVRARADADTIEARAGFTGRRDAVIAAGPQVVASDFVFPVTLQVRAADDSSSGGSGAAAAFPDGSSYRVMLPGGLAGRCLREAASGGSSSGSGSGTNSSSGTAVSLMAVQTGEQQGDAIYCGPLEGAATAALAPAPQVDASSGSSGSSIGSSTGSTGTSGSGSSSAASQEDIAPPATQANEARSGAAGASPPALAALLLAACQAAAVIVL
ncbi:hypothetical protein C2E21_6505 [Chlorella sorokiniana]|uniref:Sphingomyelin synthase-like domain-containing protein n=1 Tax=Chlorella sorokiniana TaxID=3076 RepID=A0A2P6TJV9_CHLSO|nr:hypothetical protein C2E21_6505 [Chlorella sorokiniana]|eukprot:PRW44370.1 hypothetical protein C2E21_6505 [Chlorella sorokiniana]